jgi:hypothetical protein
MTSGCSAARLDLPAVGREAIQGRNQSNVNDMRKSAIQRVGFASVLDLYRYDIQNIETYPVRYGHCPKFISATLQELRRSSIEIQCPSG